VTDPEIRIKDISSPHEKAIRERFVDHFEACPIPCAELLKNLGLFVKWQDLARILFIDDLYRRIIEVPGVIVELGVRWGQNLALFSALRTIYEPFNHNRKVIGFDTFAGFPSVHPKDGTDDIMRPGSYGVTPGYAGYLRDVLEYHEQESPRPHICKHELITGDAAVELPQYLERNPHTIVALAYLDLDLYEPTLRCLEALRGHLTRGSVLGFDELNLRDFPGETLALKETLGLDRFPIRRTRYSGVNAFLVIE
jgi:hypothetical protein